MLFHHRLLQSFPRLHRRLGTEDQGAVRFSWSCFNTEEEPDAAAEAVRILTEEA